MNATANKSVKSPSAPVAAAATDIAAEIAALRAENAALAAAVETLKARSAPSPYKAVVTTGIPNSTDPSKRWGTLEISVLDGTTDDGRGVYKVAHRFFLNRSFSGTRRDGASEQGWYLRPMQEPVAE